MFRTFALDSLIFNVNLCIVAKTNFVDFFLILKKLPKNGKQIAKILET
jgi:hypothetical protein